MSAVLDSNWFEDYVGDEEDDQIQEYDITSSPNDFNVITLFNFIESGAVRIPGFQRNFVWDLSRSSKLIESLIVGLPVPQIFMYEAERNQFLVIDGQQRLMSLYYFIKKKFPKKDKRAEIRSIFDRDGTLPEATLEDPDLFEPFRLKLSETSPDHPNKFKGLSYATLGEYKSRFDLRPIRVVIIKQNAPQDDDSSMFEIFNRLNTGGINLKPQEIRTSMYHSDFYKALYKANNKSEWRRLLNDRENDIHMKDVEILLRGFAMLMEGDSYSPSMVKFLNRFSRKCKSLKAEDITYLAALLDSFLLKASALPTNAFLNKKNNRFNVALFEAVFAAACARAYSKKEMFTGTLSADKILQLESDQIFLDALKEGTTQTKNVKNRLERAREIIGSD